jgi:enoyl-CoA hydratase
MYHTHVEVAKTPAAWTMTFRSAEERKPPAMDLALFSQMHAALDAVEAEAAAPNSPRALVLRSASAKTFLAGANIAVLATLDARTMGSWIAEGHRLLDRMESLPIPVIAIVAGYALGGGLELALACDWIYATADARFGQTEARLGFVSGWGGTHRLVRRVGIARARELLLTARIVAADEAAALGLVNFVGDAAAVESRLAAAIADIATTSRGSLARIKGILNGDREAGLASAMRETVASQLAIADPETLARVRAFLDGKR